MNKQQFLHLLNRYDTLAGSDIAELNALQRAFPYCQVFRILAARCAYQNALPVQEAQLKLAALYAPNRSAMKRFVTSQEKDILEAPEPHTPAPQAESIAWNSTPSPTPTASDDSATPTDDPEYEAEHVRLLKELPSELITLKRTRGYFEEEVERLASHNGKSVKMEAGAQRAASQRQTASVKKQAAPKKKAAKHTKPVKKIPSTKKAAKKTAKPIKKTAAKKVIATKRKSVVAAKKRAASKFAPTWKKLKQQEQLEIIDRFIRTAPPSRANSEQSARAQATARGEAISESLAEALLSQGKKEKAMEMFRKLIWRDPQRKDYFMAQIRKIEASL